MDEPELSEGARLLAAARTISTTHHAFVKLLFGANDAVTASMDAAALDTDRGAVRGTGCPIYYLRRREGGIRRVFPMPKGLITRQDTSHEGGTVDGVGRSPAGGQQQKPPPPEHLGVRHRAKCFTNIYI